MFEIYGTENCPNCKIAQYLVRSKKKEFEYKVIGVDTTKEEMLERIPERWRDHIRTVPQIFKNGTYVGGLAELEKELNI